MAPLDRLQAAVRSALESVSLRTVKVRFRLTGWIPVAQCEDDPVRCPFGEYERLYPSRMAQLVATFDPAKFRPAVVVGTRRADPGPAHYVGEYGPVDGYVAALEFDGIHLWARFAEIIEADGTGRIEADIAAGALGRSIGFWLGDPDDDDPTKSVGGFRLRHVALLTGEPEGQLDAGLPPLSAYFRSRQSLLANGEAVRADETKFRSAAPVWPIGKTPARSRALAKEEPSMPLTEAEIAAIASQMSTAVQPMITTALAPVSADVASIRTELGTVQTELAATRTALTQAQTQTREQAIRSRLDACVRAGQLPPGELDFEVQSLATRTDADVDARIAAIQARRSAPSPTVLRINGASGERSIELPLGMSDVERASAAAVLSLADEGEADSYDLAQQYERAGYMPPWGGN